MAERYNESPTKASYAFWTFQNVWLKDFSYNQRKQENHEVNSDKPQIKEQHVQKYADETNKKASNSEYTQSDENRIITSEVNSIDPIRDRSTEDDEDERVRENVWSDVDDELYIANLIKLRTSNEVKREKRDTSVYGGSDISEEVVNSVKLDKYAMWEIEPTDLTECDCLGPPPEFLLPPPPRPPFLQSEYYCGDDPIPDLETCDTEPVSIIKNNK